LRAFASEGPASVSGGRLYAVNTAAGIAAVILVTFVTIPLFSVRATMIGAVVLLAATAAALAAASRPLGPRVLPVPVLAAAVATTAIVATPDWRPSLFATAVYRYADRYATMSRAEFEAVRNPRTSPVLFDEDGYVARVTVVGPSRDPSLLLDGKGASAGGDVPTETLLAQLPILIHGAPRRVLVIGHGAGVTTRSALVHERIEEVVSIEIEKKVLDCGPLFGSPDEPPDARLRLVENDGRNFLLATSSKFDVICSQPSNPWVSGAAPLFTAEAYRAGFRKLAEGGVFCQWLQTYEMSDPNLRVLVRTFAGEFPHVAMFTSTAAGNVFLIGSAREITLDRRRLDSLGSGHLGVQLRRALIESPAGVLALFCFRDDDLRAFAGMDGPRNTDDTALIEFALPFDLFTNRTDELHATLRRASRGLPALVSWPADIPAEARAMDWANWARSFESAKKPELQREAVAEAERLVR
jgi:spermidine synthase